MVSTRKDDDRLVVGLSCDPALPRPPRSGRPVGKGVFDSLVGVVVGVERSEEGGELNDDEDEWDEVVDRVGLDLELELWALGTRESDEPEFCLPFPVAFSLPFLLGSSDDWRSPSEGSRSTINVLASLFDLNSLISSLISSLADFASSSASPANVGARVRPTIVPPRVRYALGEMVEFEMVRSRWDGLRDTPGETAYPLVDDSGNTEFDGVMGGEDSAIEVDRAVSGRFRLWILIL